MSRKICSLAIAALLLFLCCGALLAQNTPPSTNSPAQPRRGRNWDPCWQQAGIAKSAMEQRWAIERETRSQVEAVCSNSSLTPQQKHEQVKEIRHQAHQKMEGLITAEQEKALTACQQQRSMNHSAAGGSGGGPHEGGAGGCGEWPHGGARPGGASNGGNGSTSNPPPATPSSPQN
jgi:Spy/CpxP family protein refolding chaperone